MFFYVISLDDENKLKVRTFSLLVFVVLEAFRF